MKRRLPSTILGLIICAGTPLSVSAQHRSTGPAPQPQNHAQRLFDEYKTRGHGSPSTEEKLIQVLGARLPRTESNTAAIRSLLVAPATPSERAHQARLLAEQYDRTQKTPRNDAIVRDLRILARSADRDVARAATFGMTRLGFVSGFEEIIGEAKNAGVIDAQEYLGEVAHNLPFAPPADQGRLARILREAKNDYASEIVAMLINSAVFSKPLSGEARTEIGALLDETEPQFPTALGVFDLIASVRYANWLHAVATVRASVLNKEGAELVMSKLRDARTEPRKVMAYLSSQYADELFKIVNEKSRYLPLLHKVTLYAKQFPNNRGMQELAMLVMTKVGSLPR